MSKGMLVASPEKMNVVERILCGGTIGLFVAALISLAATWIANENASKWFENDKMGELVDVTWNGFTLAEIHTYVCCGLAVAFPLLVAICQIKPMFPMFATRRWFYLALPLTVFAVTLATYYFVSTQMSWLWLGM